MDNLFCGYRKRTKEELIKLWDEAIFCFDSSAFLNLYRYSKSARDEIISAIKVYKDRIHLPYHVAYEYNKNRYDSIYDQIKIYKDFYEKFASSYPKNKSEYTPPFLDEKVTNLMDSALLALNDEVKKKIESLEKLIDKDEIYEELVSLFKDKISESYDNNKLEKIFKEGEVRYAKLIPPGYKDKNKTENKFGDLVIWMQLIDIALKKKQPIIFIVDDNKEDWWWKMKNGKTIGPRHELTSEIKLKANVDFHMYTSINFVKHIDDFSLNAIKEIETVNNSFNDLSWDDFEPQESIIGDNMNYLLEQSRLIAIKARINSIENQLAILSLEAATLPIDDISDSHLKMISDLKILKEEEKRIEKKIEKNVILL